jgi:hypothetical protein
MDVGTRITQEQLSLAFNIKTVSLKASLQNPKRSIIFNDKLQTPIL